MSGDRIVRPHAGWQGQFTTQEQPGAYPNGTRIRKVRMDFGDTHKVGSTGRVLGSLSNPSIGIGYFIEWDHWPRTAVFIMGAKIRPEATGEVVHTHHWNRNTPLNGR
jgi:hypothetical protein